MNESFDLVIISQHGVLAGRWTKEMYNAVVQNYKYMDTAECFELHDFKNTIKKLEIYTSK